MATDFNTLALLHQWFPDVYPAPPAVAAAPDQPSPAAPAAAQTVDGIVSGEPSGGGAFGGPERGPEQSQGPAGAFSDPGQGTAASSSSSSGRSIGDRLSTIGDRIVERAPSVAANMAGKAALGALGVTGPAAMAAMGAGRTIYDIAMAPENLSIGDMAKTALSNLDPTRSIAHLLGLPGVLEALGLNNPARDSLQAATDLAEGAKIDQQDDDAASHSFHDAFMRGDIAPLGGPTDEGQGSNQGGPGTDGGDRETGREGFGSYGDAEHEGGDTGYAHGGIVGQLLYHDPYASGGTVRDNRLAMLMALMKAHQERPATGRGAF